MTTGPAVKNKKERIIRWRHSSVRQVFYNGKFSFVDEEGAYSDPFFVISKFLNDDTNLDPAVYKNREIRSEWISYVYRNIDLDLLAEKHGWGFIFDTFADYLVWFERHKKMIREIGNALIALVFISLLFLLGLGPYIAYHTHYNSLIASPWWWLLPLWLVGTVASFWVLNWFEQQWPLIQLQKLLLQTEGDHFILNIRAKNQKYLNSKHSNRMSYIWTILVLIVWALLQAFVTFAFITSLHDTYYAYGGVVGDAWPELLFDIWLFGFGSVIVGALLQFV